MLPRHYRLPLPYLGTDKTTKFPLFTVKSTKTNRPFSRFAFVVSKRVDKRAVVRNRTKRMFREIVHELLPQMVISQDIVIIVQRVVSREQATLVKEQLSQSLLKNK